LQLNQIRGQIEEIRSLLLNWGLNCINSRRRTKVKEATNFRAVVWFLAGMQLHWFLNQNCNLGFDWTNHRLRTNVKSNTFLPPFPFKWNDTFCPKRRRFIHCSRKKKRKGSKWSCFVGTVGLFLPFDVRGRGRRRFFLPLSLPCLS